MRSLRRLAFVAATVGAVTALVPLGCSGQNDTPHPPPSSDLDATMRDTYVPPRDTGTPIDTGVLDVAREVSSDAQADGGADGAGDGPSDAPLVDRSCGTTCCDGIQDGMETDVDCGGLLCPACANGLHCTTGTDCQSLDCAGSDPGTCLPPTCMDNIQNQGETDVDCGGPNCAPCIVGKKCQGTNDCISHICTMNVCSCPPGMVIFPTALPSGGDYCIDGTEVLLKDYEAFWTANPVPMNQPSYCSWNMTYTPGGDWPPDLIPMDPGCNATWPVHYVDWCDAYAYCAWAGKHLCGNIAGGHNPIASENDHLQSEWYNACSAQGVQTYPYSGPYQACRCNGADFWGCFDAGVAPQTYADEYNCQMQQVDTACQGGASNLFQMSGNVAEWEDSCDNFTGMGDNCLARGGSFQSSSTALACPADATELTPRNAQSVGIGFRCCL